MSEVFPVLSVVMIHIINLVIVCYTSCLTKPFKQLSNLTKLLDFSLFKPMMLINRSLYFTDFIQRGAAGVGQGTAHAAGADVQRHRHHRG